MFNVWKTDIKHEGLPSIISVGFGGRYHLPRLCKCRLVRTSSPATFSAQANVGACKQQKLEQASVL
jgi:hypothetical protein